MLKLNCQAISNTYDDIIDNRSCWDEANLGPEDIRYLKLLRDLASEQGG